MRSDPIAIIYQGNVVLKEMTYKCEVTVFRLIYFCTAIRKPSKEATPALFNVFFNPSKLMGALIRGLSLSSLASAWKVFN